MDLAEARPRPVVASPRHPWERARFEVVRRLVARHLVLRRGAVVLDVGCGDTFVVDRFARMNAGVRFYGVDTAFTSDTIRHYREQSNVSNVRLHQSLDDVDLDAAGTAALVLLMDVIEHVEDEATLIRDLLGRPYIDDETWFVITVPAYQRLFSAHDRFLGHYRRYSRTTARQRLDRAGLTLVQCGYFFACLLPVRALQVLRERMLRAGSIDAQTGVASWGWGAVLGNVLTTLLVLDERVARALDFVGIALPGLSLFAICRKSA